MACCCRQTLQYTLSLCDKLRNIKAGMLAYVVAVRNARDESIRAGLVKYVVPAFKVMVIGLDDQRLLYLVLERV